MLNIFPGWTVSNTDHANMHAMSALVCVNISACMSAWVYTRAGMQTVWEGMQLHVSVLCRASARPSACTREPQNPPHRATRNRV